MRPFRCLICGETYIGRVAPDRCPFCGVDGRLLVDAAEYVSYDGMEMSEQTRDLVHQAMKVEKSNVAFYQACAKKAKSEVVRALFKRIGKHEFEHLDLLSKHAGEKTPEVEPEDCTDDDAENMKQAHAREDRAVKMYMRSAAEATEPRAREVFSAISGIEQEHYKLFNTFR